MRCTHIAGRYPWTYPNDHQPSGTRGPDAPLHFESGTWGAYAKNEGTPGRQRVIPSPIPLVLRMNLTPKDVDHVAALARLGITPEERARFADQLSGVLEHFAALQALDTSGVSPTAQVQDLRNVMRDDVARPSAPRDAILLNAPRQEDGFFRVQAVLDA